MLQPTFLPGLTITADYFDITIDDAIITVPAADGVRSLLHHGRRIFRLRSAPVFVGTRDCDGAFTRDNPPQFGVANVARLETSGIDLQVNYGIDLPFSAHGQRRVRPEPSFLGTWTESNRGT